MKPLTLTHVAEETDLRSASTTFFLVFNGKVRVEVTKEVLEQTLREIQTMEDQEEPYPVSVNDDEDDVVEVLDENGTAQI